MIFKNQIISQIITISLSVLIVSFAVGFVVFAWVEPEEPPGGIYNVPPPLNASANSQTKSGGLILNTGGAEYGFAVEQGKVGIGTLNPTEALDLNSGNFVTTGKGTFGVSNGIIIQAMLGDSVSEIAGKFTGGSYLAELGGFGDGFAGKFTDGTNNVTLADDIQGLYISGGAKSMTATGAVEAKDFIMKEGKFTVQNSSGTPTWEIYESGGEFYAKNLINGKTYVFSVQEVPAP